MFFLLLSINFLPSTYPEVDLFPVLWCDIFFAIGLPGLFHSWLLASLFVVTYPEPDTFPVLCCDTCFDIVFPCLFFLMSPTGLFSATYPRPCLFPAFCPSWRISSSLSVPDVNILTDLDI